MTTTLSLTSLITNNRITSTFTAEFLPKFARYGELYVVAGVLYIYADLDKTGKGKWFPLTNKKEVLTYEQSVVSNIWTIPIPVNFSIDFLQTLVYDQNNNLHRFKYSIDYKNKNLILTFAEEIKGQALLVFKEANDPDFINSRFSVGGDVLTVGLSDNRDGKNYITLNTEFIKFASDGTTEFSKKMVIDDDLVVNGDLLIKGMVSTVETGSKKIEDNILILNSNATGIPQINAGIELNRGDSGNLPLLTFDEEKDVLLFPVKQLDGEFLQDEIIGKTYFNQELSKLINQNQNENSYETIFTTINDKEQVLLSKISNTEQSLLSTINDKEQVLLSKISNTEQSLLSTINDKEQSLLSAIDDNTAKIDAIGNLNDFINAMNNAKI